MALRDLTSAIEVDAQDVNPPPGWTTSLRQPSQLAAEYDHRGTVYEAIGDHEHAIADYDEAICLDPDKASWWIDLADVYQHQGRFEDAVSCYSQAIRLEPDKQLCWLGLARLLKQTGQCETAMAALSAVFDPGKPNLLSLLLRADIYRCLGDDQRAISDYYDAIRLDPSNALIWWELAKLFKETQQYDKDALDKTIAAASEAVQLHPERAETYSVRATFYNIAGDHEKAIADADRSIQISPRDVDAYLERGFAYVKRESYDKALQDFTQVIRLNPGDANARHWRAFVLMRLRKYHEAAADLVQASIVDPKAAVVFNSLAWLLATCPDPTVRDGSKATDYISHGLQLDSNDKLMWDTRAAVFAENGDFNSAVTWEEHYLQREDLADDQRRRAIERLALYKAGKPYREEPK